MVAPGREAKVKMWSNAIFISILRFKLIFDTVFTLKSKLWHREGGLENEFTEKCNIDISRMFSESLNLIPALLPPSVQTKKNYMYAYYYFFAKVIPHIYV